MDRRLFLKSMGASVSLLTVAGCGGDAGAPPNIVLIMADDMGYGDVGCYNPGSRIPTPNMDRLAAQGIRFTDVHTPSALCTPTRYGLLTGRYCWRTRLKRGVLLGYDETPLIEEDRATLGSLLQSAGYETSCIGKWHLGLHWSTRDGYVLRDDHDRWREDDEIFRANEDHVDFTAPVRGGPADLGFDHAFFTAGCSTSDPPYAFIENRHVVDPPTSMSPEEYEGLPGFVPGRMSDGWSQEDVDPRFTREAVEFIRNHRREQPDRPFFLYFAPSSPHIPFMVPEFMKGVSEAGPRGDLVALVDWCVGELARAVDELGLAEDTLFIVTSDNGPRRNQGEHESAAGLRGYKGDIWEGGHRVPFIARWPGRIPAGAESGAVFSLTDMMATFAALSRTEIPAPGGEDSFDELPVLLGERARHDSPRPRIFHSAAGAFAIRLGKWKLIQGTEGSGRADFDPTPEELKNTGQLYDLQADPGENNDLWYRHPEVVERLLSMLEEFQAGRPTATWA